MKLFSIDHRLVLMKLDSMYENYRPDGVILKIFLTTMMIRYCLLIVAAAVDLYRWWWSLLFYYSHQQSKYQILTKTKKINYKAKQMKNTQTK